MGFGYTPTKKTFSATNDTGTITTYALKGDYNVMENLAVGLDLPFYWGNKKALGKSRFGLGNMGINTNWNQNLNASTDDFGWGYSISLSAYFPTANKAETGAMADANPTLDLPRYARGWTTVTPMAGLFVQNEWFSAKGNIGMGYTLARKKYTATGDKNRFNTPAQLGVSFRAMPELAINAEYNTILLDKATQNEASIGTQSRRFRQTITPSISGEFANVVGQVYGNIPVDSTTRKASAFSAGLNVGYTF